MEAFDNCSIYDLKWQMEEMNIFRNRAIDVIYDDGFAFRQEITIVLRQYL